MLKYLGLLLFVGIIVSFVILFLQSASLKMLASSKNEWTLVLGGDVMLGRSVTGFSLDTKNNPSYPFLDIEKILRDGNLSFVNLESPIVEKCPRRSEGMVFCAPYPMIQGLVDSGVDIVNLSNNHTLNYGTKGYDETKQNLDLNEIKYAEHDKLLVINIDKIKVGFIGFDKSQLGNPNLSETEEQLILSSRKNVDVLIVAMHWGIEYKAHPTEGQRLLAKKLVELGVDLIVGHHPHWVQDVDHIGAVPVYYSLGNLIFDQMWSEETKKGLMVKVTFSGKNILKEEQIPVYMSEFAKPLAVY